MKQWCAMYLFLYHNVYILCNYLLVSFFYSDWKPHNHTQYLQVVCFHCNIYSINFHSCFQWWIQILKKRVFQTLAKQIFGWWWYVNFMQIHANSTSSLVTDIGLSTILPISVIRFSDIGNLKWFSEIGKSADFLISENRFTDISNSFRFS